MKSIIRINLILALFLLGLGLSAQNNYHENNYYFRQNSPRVTIGAKAGLNISELKGHPENMKSDVGFNAGIVVDYNFNANLYLSSGLEFYNKRIKYDHGVYSIPGYDIVIPSSSKKAMYLQVPLHLGYKFYAADMFRIAPHVGPYVAYGVGGRIEVGEEVHINGEVIGVNEFVNRYPGFKKVGDTFGDYGFKKFDYGIGVGILFEYDRVGLGVNYDFGLKNISRGSDKINTRSGYVTLGYKFN
ncbi:MAG: porin family protein [Dysgonomonas sp.]